MDFEPSIAGRIRGPLGALAATALMLSAAPPAGAATPATAFGVAAAVHGPVRLLRAGDGEAVPLRSGMMVAAGDRILTGADGGLQVLLSDASVFTLGDGTEWRLDSFRYAPGAGGGELRASLERGSFKLVTGRVAEEAAGRVSVTMPTGEVRLLGTMVAGESEDDGDTVALLGPGAQKQSADKKGSFVFIPKGAAVQTAEDEIVVYRAGYAVTVDPDGNVSEPFEMSGREFGQLVASLARTRGRGGDEMEDEAGGGDMDEAVDESIDEEIDDDALVEDEDMEDLDELAEEGDEDVRDDPRGVLENQPITELADLEDIAGLKGRFVETGLEMEEGGSFDFRFEFGTAVSGELDFIGFENINTAGVAGGELSWDTAVDGAPTFEELDLSQEEGTLVDKGACAGVCTGSITVQNAGQGAAAKFFAVELETGDDSFADRLVRPGGNNNFPQD